MRPLLSKAKWIIAGAIFALTMSAIPGDAPREKAAMPVQVVGNDQQYQVDVILDGGVRKMAVQSTTIVEEVFGQDPQASTFFYFGSTLEDANGIGAANDTVRVEIPAANSPLNAIYPAVDVTYTITAADVASDNPERTVAEHVCDELEGDSDFEDAEWDCQVIKDFGAVYISSKLFNEWGERTTYTLTCSGTTTCNKGEGDIARRGKPTELSPSPNDPRQGVLAISGSVVVTPGSISDSFEGYLTNATYDDDMNQNGSLGTPICYAWNANGTSTYFVQRLSLHLQDNGIKYYTNFGVIAALTNGITTTIVSDGITTTRPTLKRTEDLKHEWTQGDVRNYLLEFAPGTDDVVATATYDPPFPIRAGTSDKVEMCVRDNLSAISTLHVYIAGFEKEE